MNFAWVFGLFLFCHRSTHHHVPVSHCWESVGWRKMMDRSSATSKRHEHHTVLLTTSVKWHLKEYLIPACAVRWLKAMSCTGAGWPISYFYRGKNFSTQQRIMQQFGVIGECCVTVAKRDGDDTNILFMTSVYQQVLLPEKSKWHTRWQQIVYVQAEVTHPT